MYYLPQEIEVWYIIPTIRKSLSKELVKRHGFTLQKTGNALGVSKAAVSQYLNKKRGKSLKLPRSVKAEVKVSADLIAKGEKEAFHEIMRLLTICRIAGVGCLACKKFNKGVLEKCKVHPAGYRRE